MRPLSAAQRLRLERRPTARGEEKGKEEAEGEQRRSDRQTDGRTALLGGEVCEVGEEKAAGGGAGTRGEEATSCA